MVRESIVTAGENNRSSCQLTGWTLIVLALSVSIDALAAGFSLGMLEVDLVLLSSILGLVIFIIGILGLGLGRSIGCFIGLRAGLVGGIVLVILGGHVVWKTFY
jgi:putative Mn2+ efflux pump MntP